MKQFVLSDKQTQLLSGSSGALTVSDRDYHYLIRVLRYKEKDTFPAIDRMGREYTCSIDIIYKDTASIQITPRSASPRDTADNWSIILFQCLPKGKKMDMIVRQATEAGADVILPVISSHTVSRPDTDAVSGKLKRWRTISIEATQQSGRKNPCEILEPKQLTDLEENLKRLDICLFFHQELLENNGLHRYLSNIPDHAPISKIGVIIGPEGGLSKQETDWLSARGCKPVYLGPRVLRTETAPVYALGAIQTILLEKSEWQHVKE